MAYTRAGIKEGEEMALMLMNTKVFITAIVSGCIVVLALIGALVFLASKGSDAGTILAFVATLMSVFTLIMQGFNRAATVETKASVAALQQQTNGTQSKLIDAAIAAPPPPPKNGNGVTNAV